MTTVEGAARSRTLILAPVHRRRLYITVLAFANATECEAICSAHGSPCRKGARSISLVEELCRSACNRVDGSGGEAPPRDAVANLKQAFDEAEKEKNKA